LNGFYVYLAIFDLANKERHAGVYYGALGVALLFAAYLRRGHLFPRLTTPDRIVRGWLVAACALGLWFVANGLLYRVGGHETNVILGVFAALTVPAVLLALTLDRQAFRELLVGVVALGCAFAVADCIALVQGPKLVDGRFTPLASIDPITAGLVPAVAAAALLGLETGVGPRRLLYGAVLALLIAAAVLAGSRGPVVTLVLVLLTAVLCQWRQRLALVCAALLVGGALAWSAGTWVGSSRYLAQSVRDTSPPVSAPTNDADTTPTPPSTIRMRWYWIKSALRAVPDKPLLGHGIVSLRDRSPAAYALGVGGELVYPHNDAVEAIYSLGVIGFFPFLLALVAPAFLIRRRGVAYSAGILFVAAFAESNFSGEIGLDSVLWTTSALLVAARADRCKAPLTDASPAHRR
jgi:O-antigen ligase